jgi:hypothetical protein
MHNLVQQQYPKTRERHRGRYRIDAVVSLPLPSLGEAIARAWDILDWKSPLTSTQEVPPVVCAFHTSGRGSWFESRGEEIRVTEHPFCIFQPGNVPSTSKLPQGGLGVPGHLLPGWITRRSSKFHFQPDNSHISLVKTTISVAFL